MATYLVSGVAGFIASRVTEMLLADGHRVVGVDNVNDAYDPCLKEWRLRRLLGKPGFQFHRGSIEDPETVEVACRQAERIDGVVNLAARAGVRQSMETPQVYLATNVTGTLNLLEFCRRRGVRKFVLASTSSLYGAHNAMPYREDADTSRCLSPYAASKKAAEVLCYSYHMLYDLDVTVCRYFTVYGPAGRPDMSPFRFVKWISEGEPVQIYGDGQQSRDFTYVDDIARGTIASLHSSGYQTINLGSDRPVVLLDMVRLIERLVGREARLVFHPGHPADVPATWADITRARAALGWEPRTSHEQGVTNLVGWYQENRSWARAIRT